MATRQVRIRLTHQTRVKLDALRDGESWSAAISRLVEEAYDARREATRMSASEDRAA